MMRAALGRHVFSWPHAPAETFAPLADDRFSLWLDSNRPGHPLSRYSYICWAPFETLTAKDGRTAIRTGDGMETTADGDPFTILSERLARAGHVAQDPALPPFQGGAAGMFGYDLARGIEKLPAFGRPHDEPDMAVGFYRNLVAYDHQTGAAWFICHAPDRAAADGQRQDLLRRIASFAGVPAFRPFNPAWQAGRCSRDYIHDIQAVIDYIRAGDIFQANLSRRFTATMPSSFGRFSHYLNLRDVNPAPFGAYFNLGDLTLSSCSPERFLSLSGGRVETRPIKGTAPAWSDPALLAGSEKDRAENIMIVDLLRNDLSKLCEDHSVTVDALCGIETFEGLHHMVSRVSARLRPGGTASDLLRACFPGGSITGAPKIRAMEIIDALEPHRRGAYCGALGWIGFDGDMDSAITIRTLAFSGDEARLQTGGGITVLSDPQAEMEETQTKAAKLFESFERLAT